ncbi:hypothetical protein L1987_05315 [Smallanthus sonchifolius]|uniref:Uncharacterized protein n=1 Tax=Smallanthus sonchifolius TaxID=185202 RepID=A0ACB9JV93_9ASTR|nr:hypothetical protein L1987_05315 [Smallanthus sonchifolius]
MFPSIRVLVPSHMNMSGGLLEIIQSTIVLAKCMAIKPPKDKKSNRTGEYTISMGEYTCNTNTPGFGISLDDDDDDIQAEQEPPSPPIGRDKAKSIGRDKAKAKGKAMSSSDYEAKKLSLIEELAETNRVKKQAIEQFDQKIDKFYELEQRKFMGEI